MVKGLEEIKKQNDEAVALTESKAREWWERSKFNFFWKRKAFGLSYDELNPAAKQEILELYVGARK